MLKDIRETRGLTQKELSIKSGVPERTIRSYEQNTRDIKKASWGTLVALSDVLQCGIHEIIN